MPSPIGSAPARLPLKPRVEQIFSAARVHTEPEASNLIPCNPKSLVRLQKHSGGQGTRTLNPLRGDPAPLNESTPR